MCPALSPPLPPSSTSLDTEYLKPIPNSKNNTVMKTTIYSLLAAAACGMAFGQTTAYTTPVGYVSQTCLSLTDTLVGLPLRVATSGAGAVSGAPDLLTTPGSAILTIAGTPGFTVNGFAGTCFVKFTSGAASGKFYTVTSNAESTITINLNGDTLSAVAADTLVVSKFWTLGELFVPSASTSDPATTGNAIVVTTSTLSRKTEVLLPNIAGNGINLSSAGTYFIFNGAWRKVGQPATTSFNTQQLWPDNSFVVRQPTLAVPTTYTISGEVDTGNLVLGLRTQNATKQDNFVGLPRPVNTTLNALALGGTSAFVTTTSTLSRKDELLVFNNATAGKNKAASATYFWFNSAWRKVGQPATTDFGTDVITAGNGFIIRKSNVTGGPTAFWNNTASY
jgi:uncharacterized protein (TIGR02597 family)